MCRVRGRAVINSVVFEGTPVVIPVNKFTYHSCYGHVFNIMVILPLVP
jgi:hypothetical protein